MYVIDHSPSYARIFYPEKAIKEPLSVSEIGVAEQPAGYDSGSDQSNSTRLYYVLSGKGYFNGISFSAPAMLFINPNTNLRYTVDESSDKFKIYWVKIWGDHSSALLRQAGFSLENGVFQIEELERIREVFGELTRAENYKGVNDSLFMLGGLYRLLSLHSSHASLCSPKRLSGYTLIVLNHIHESFMHPITEKELADLVNLSTNHMHKVFLSDMKTTPINYLNSYRIRKAKELLRDTDLPISRIAETVGISGGDYFCRVFRKYNDSLSPTEYRKSLKS